MRSYVKKYIIDKKNQVSDDMNLKKAQKLFEFSESLNNDNF